MNWKGSKNKSSIVERNQENQKAGEEKKECRRGRSTKDLVNASLSHLKRFKTFFILNDMQVHVCLLIHCMALFTRLRERINI